MEGFSFVFSMRGDCVFWILSMAKCFDVSCPPIHPKQRQIAGRSIKRGEEGFCHESSTGIKLWYVSTVCTMSGVGCGWHDLTKSFISEISLSTSSMNCIMKSTSLCFSISSVWKFVIKKEIS